MRVSIVGNLWVILLHISTIFQGHQRVKLSSSWRASIEALFPLVIFDSLVTYLSIGSVITLYSMIYWFRLAVIPVQLCLPIPQGSKTLGCRLNDLSRFKLDNLGLSFCDSHYSNIFLENTHKGHSIAHPWEWGMECLSWVQILKYILYLPLSY